MKSERTAIVALGSNQGNSRKILHRALERLRSLSAEQLQVSSLWETEPVDCPPGAGTFLNAVAIFNIGKHDTPETLLAALKKIENEFGRQRDGTRNATRTLDLDLIAFGEERRSGPDLILPHPRTHQRRFVLAPLAEVAPDYILPGQSKNVSELLAEAAASPWARKIEA